MNFTHSLSVAAITAQKIITVSLPTSVGCNQAKSPHMGQHILLHIRESAASQICLPSLVYLLVLHSPYRQNNPPNDRQNPWEFLWTGDVDKKDFVL